MRARANVFVEKWLRARATFFSGLSGDKMRVQLSQSQAVRVGEGRAKRREGGVHTAHTRTPSLTTFDTERADLKN